jgi:hypothetical protein
MNDDSMIRSAIHTKTLQYSPSPDMEEIIARSILAWLDAQTGCVHYYQMIKDLNGLDNYDIQATESLRFNLWMRCDACLWPAPYQIKSSNDLLWQFAIIRASRLLNTPIHA